MGLNTGPVPPRVHAEVKAGLLGLIDHAASEGGWSVRRAAAVLGLDHARVLRWRLRAAAGRLDDARPGPAEAPHALLEWERATIIELAEAWGETDLSHRKLAHRGSYLDRVYVSESTVLRVLTETGFHLPERGQREPRQARPWPEWAELVPGVIWIYDFTHFGAAGVCAVAVLDVISRKWLSVVVSAEESSTQVEIAFTRALIADGKDHLLDAALLDELRTGTVPDDPEVPVLLMLSDNGPQMTSNATATLAAAVRVARHFGRPGTPNDQAWIESFFGHLKHEHPHLEKITDPGELEAELDRLMPFYNDVRLHAGIGYVTPNDEHQGRGTEIRKARRDGLTTARQTRIETRRKLRQDHD